jgi:hypothetical protein
MKTLSHHINTLKEQPHHVRKQVAMGGALGFAVLIGLIWLGANLATNSFMIQGASFADATTKASTLVSVPAGNDNLAGAAAAGDQSNQAAHIQIVDTNPASTSSAPARTVIPF